jgi:hypothetical protein
MDALALTLPVGELTFCVDLEGALRELRRRNLP